MLLARFYRVLSFSHGFLDCIQNYSELVVGCCLLFVVLRVLALVVFGRYRINSKSHKKTTPSKAKKQKHILKKILRHHTKTKNNHAPYPSENLQKQSSFSIRATKTPVTMLITAKRALERQGQPWPTLSFRGIRRQTTHSVPSSEGNVDYEENACKLTTGHCDKSFIEDAPILATSH